MMIALAFTAGVAVTSLVASCAVQRLLSDSIVWVAILQRRIESLEAHRDGLQVKLARVADRRDRWPGQTL